MSFDLSAKEIAQRLGKASACGNGWKACCPAHDDKNPSLVIYDRPGRRPYFECMAGCDYRDIATECVRLGLMPGKRSAKVTSRRPRPPTLTRSTPVSPVPPYASEPDYLALLGWSPTTIYRYLDADERLLYLIARRDLAIGSKDIRPIVFVRAADGTTAWKARAPSEPRPLYVLDLLAKRPDAPVLVVEGEKAANAARERLKDYVVVTWSGGANAVGKADWSPLKGRDVVLCPDNDEAGKKAMQLLAAGLQAGR